MRAVAQALTEFRIRATKGTQKPFRLLDGDGLFLWVTPPGGKIWRLRYTFAGTERILVLGKYPGITLADAREAARTARADVQRGVDPAVTKRKLAIKGVAAAEAIFEVIAREWWTAQKDTWVARHADDVLTSLERDAFPLIGRLPVSEIDPPIVLKAGRGGGARGDAG